MMSFQNIRDLKKFELRAVRSTAVLPLLSSILRFRETLLSKEELDNLIHGAARRLYVQCTPYITTHTPQPCAPPPVTAITNVRICFYHFISTLTWTIISDEYYKPYKQLKARPRTLWRERKSGVGCGGEPKSAWEFSLCVQRHGCIT